MSEPKDFPPYHNAETWKIAQEREAEKPEGEKFLVEAVSYRDPELKLHAALSAKEAPVVPVAAPVVPVKVDGDSK